MIFVDPMIEKRDSDMESMKKEGYTVTQIGKYFNLTKQRVSKILIQRRNQSKENES